ncbi:MULTISPECIES: hypothetical protein [unclassified Streptomyces]|uniref:hypothetical protein n=1 Tax=unclassified Streptomyces TaxID=2593676 RepID=UPI000823CA62|nr:hypothetical protein YW7DRAFT_04804 [Streptomyces sp. AmelKG-E11A]
MHQRTRLADITPVVRGQALPLRRPARLNTLAVQVVNAFSTVAERGVQQPGMPLRTGLRSSAVVATRKFRSAPLNVYGWACPVAGEVGEAVVLPS